MNQKIVKILHKKRMGNITEITTAIGLILVVALFLVLLLPGMISGRRTDTEAVREMDAISQEAVTDQAAAGQGGTIPAASDGASGDALTASQETGTGGSIGATDQDWKLTLVNRWNEIPEDYSVELEELANGQAVDARIYPELQEMFDDARSQGIYPLITSSYRTTQDQEYLYQQEIAKYLQQGYSQEEAVKLAQEWVGVPGTSEHQIGMAVDISTAAADVQPEEVVWEWLAENSYRYGFILRYPADKKEITGINQEEWHFRYVGKEAAREIYSRGICLEEYLQQLENS